MLASVESGPSTASEHPGASSILVVDDESTSGELVATLLRSQGYAVRWVGDAREALPLIAGGGIDLLLLDLMMSRMDGVEICAYVRNELREPLLPIVITTSLSDRESRIRAKEAGADDVLVKPIDGLELLVRIESLLKTRAHVARVVRENERLRRERNEARSLLASARRGLRGLGQSAEQLREALAAQHARPGSVEPAIGDEWPRIVQLASELAEGVGAALGRRAPEHLDGELSGNELATLPEPIESRAGAARK